MELHLDNTLVAAILATDPLLPYRLFIWGMIQLHTTTQGM